MISKVARNWRDHFYFLTSSMMYWTDWGANAKIEKAEMDGSARLAILTRNLVWPNGLTIDQASNRLFWVDAKLDIIEASDLNGLNRHKIASSTSNIHPYGLVAYENVLYWTDWNTKSIERLNLSSLSHETIVTGLKKPMDIHVFGHSLIYPGTKLTLKVLLLLWSCGIWYCTLNRVLKDNFKLNSELNVHLLTRNPILNWTVMA